MRLLVGHRVRQRQVGRPEQHELVAVAGEPGLHEQLHVAVGVGAGDVEPHRAPPGPVPQQVLDEPEADVARVLEPIASSSTIVHSSRCDSRSTRSSPARRPSSS